MEYVYHGPNPVLVAIYTDVMELDKTLALISSATAQLRRLNGTLNEDKFEGRLAFAAISTRLSMTGNEGYQAHIGQCVFIEAKRLTDVILEQEQQRTDYFRARLILSHCLLPRLRKVCVRLNSALEVVLFDWLETRLPEDVDHIDVLASLANARAALLKPSVSKITSAARLTLQDDKTNNEAERAFRSTLQITVSQLSSTRPHHINWLPQSSLPMQLQMLDCLDLPEQSNFEAVDKNRVTFNPDLVARWLLLRDEAEALLLHNTEREALMRDLKNNSASKSGGNQQIFKVPPGDRMPFMPFFARFHRDFEQARTAQRSVEKWLLDACTYVIACEARGEVVTPLALSGLLGANAILSALLKVQSECHEFCEAFVDVVTMRDGLYHALKVYQESGRQLLDTALTIGV